MSKKLTLSIDETVIEEAKAYAKQNDTSLSRLVESYLQSILEGRRTAIEITPLVEDLSGVIQLPADFDYKSEYADALNEKYQ
jgi:hypothetical protein